VRVLHVGLRNVAPGCKSTHLSRIQFGWPLCGRAAPCYFSRKGTSSPYFVTGRGLEEGHGSAKLPSCSREPRPGVCISISQAMNPKHRFTRGWIRSLLVVLCALVIIPADIYGSVLSNRLANRQASSSAGDASRISPDELDSLVAPIALYPDPLLAQTLAASTYPLEILQLHQWLLKNPGLKDKALLDAVSRQSWDPSVQAMAALADVVKRLADDIQWTTDLGNAFLAQEGEVMDAVQRMRQKAQNNGNLKSTQQQSVETKAIESKSVIVIEQADPQVVYVPSYNPVAVYGPPLYPYPPIYYPPSPPPGYYAAGMAVSFGVGVAMGAFSSGGWGWGASWGRNDITINNNNNFNRNANINGYRGGNAGNTWQHRPEHRGGAPYRDRATADRFGGTSRGDSLASRQTSARQQVGRQGGNLRSNAVGTTGVGHRAGGGGFSDRGATGGLAGRAEGAGVSGRTGGGAADRVGSRDLSRSGGSGSRNAFDGGSQRFDGSRARASGDRGSSSMRSSSGAGHHGGARHGGGGRGGGGRSGGGRSGGGGGGGRR
jgi:hypothetical protein